VNDSIWLLTARPTCHGDSDSAQKFRTHDSWIGAEVLGVFPSEEEAATDLETLVEGHNYELFGPPKQALAIIRVELT
jgi:hypothetical protein